MYGISYFSDRRDVRGAEEEEPKIIKNLHKDDILEIDVYNSGIATTASYDGLINVWSLETGHVYCSFNVNSVKGNKKYQGKSIKGLELLLQVSKG